MNCNEQQWKGKALKSAVTQLNWNIERLDWPGKFMTIILFHFYLNCTNNTYLLKYKCILFPKVLLIMSLSEPSAQMRDLPRFKRFEAFFPRTKWSNKQHFKKIPLSTLNQRFSTGGS